MSTPRLVQALRRLIPKGVGLIGEGTILAVSANGIMTVQPDGDFGPAAQMSAVTDEDFRPGQRVWIGGEIGKGTMVVLGSVRR